MRGVCTWVLCGVILLGGSGRVIGQEEGETPASLLAKFEEQWKNCSQLRTAALDLRQQIRTAAAEERKPLIEEYLKAVESLRTAMGPLEKAAEAAYRSAPNTNDSVTSVLLSAARDKLQADRYEAALEALKLLEENKCDKKELACLRGVAAYCLDDFETAEVQLTIAEKGGAIEFVPGAGDYLADCPAAKKAWEAEQALRAAEAKADDLPRVKLETNKGVIVLELFENEAPDTVGNFVSLVEKKYYDGLTFHRVLEMFMAQGGCPQGDGTGGPGYNIYCECDKPEHRNHFRGSLSMAKGRAKNTGGSQFFLTFRRTSHLDGAHTVFGRVIEGIDVLEKLQRRDPTRDPSVKPDVIVKAEVLRKRDHAYAPKKVREGE